MTDYVPGMLRCAKCSFTGFFSSLNLDNGTVTAAKPAYDTCPNGCGPLWQVSERDYRIELGEQMEQAFTEKMEIEKQLQACKEANLKIRKRLTESEHVCEQMLKQTQEYLEWLKNQ